MRRECPVCRTLQPSTVRDSREKEEWEEPGGAMIGSHLQNGAETVFFLSPLTSGVLPLESAASRSAPLSSSNRAISLRAVVGDRACARGLKHRKRGVGRRAGQIYLCVWGGSDDEGGLLLGDQGEEEATCQRQLRVRVRSIQYFTDT